MHRYRVRILKSSVGFEFAKLFDIEAANSYDAAKMAIVDALENKFRGSLGDVFTTEDLTATRIYRFKFFATDKFIVRHKRMDAFKWELEIKTV